MQRLTSVTEVLDSCSGILLDQFGVLHDGRTPYPHAVGAVRALARAGKRIVVLSNSSRRSGGTIGKLVAMGFEADWFAGVCLVEGWGGARATSRLNHTNVPSHAPPRRRHHIGRADPLLPGGAA
jgi:hypothetical protein